MINAIERTLFIKADGYWGKDTSTALQTYLKNEGYDIADYPVTYRNYACEITLPVYYDLTPGQVETVIQAVINAVVQK